MQVSIVGDEGDDDAGFVGERLEAHGAELRRFWRDDLGAHRGVIEGTDLLVLLGSDRAVHDEAERQVVATEQALVRSAESRGLPILAICYGAQLVAATLGATVAPAPAPEIGWTTLASADERRCPSGPWFQFHFDRFGEIPGIALLASTPAAPQAFVHGRTFAYQFHPEVTAATAREWLVADAARIASLGMDPEAIAAETVALEPAARRACHQLVDEFLSAVAGVAPLPAR